MGIEKRLRDEGLKVLDDSELHKNVRARIGKDADFALYGGKDAVLRSYSVMIGPDVEGYIKKHAIKRIESVIKSMQDYDKIQIKDESDKEVIDVIGDINSDLQNKILAYGRIQGIINETNSDLSLLIKSRSWMEDPNKEGYYLKDLVLKMERALAGETINKLLEKYGFTLKPFVDIKRDENMECGLKLVVGYFLDYLIPAIVNNIIVTNEGRSGGSIYTLESPVLPPSSLPVIKHNVIVTNHP